MKTKISVLLLSIFATTMSISSQEITEENYLKAGKELWEKYEQEKLQLKECKRITPEKTDSLEKEAQLLLEKAMADNAELAIRFASVPSGLEGVFRTRLSQPKERLQRVLDSLPEDMKQTAYARSLQKHIDTEQIKENDLYADFEAIDSRGNTFRLSSLHGKNILFIYGGLDCMGKSGRDYLDKLYRSTSREKLEIVVYCPSNNETELKKTAEKYPVDYYLIADFLGDHSPVKIRYGAQATPTCFMINKAGIVGFITLGLPVSELNSLFISH